MESPVKCRAVTTITVAVLFRPSPEQSQFKSLWWFRQQQLCSVSEPSGDSEHWPSLQLSSRRRNIEEILPIVDIKNYWHRIKWFSIIELISSHILYLHSSFTSAQGYSGWKEKYSRAESFSSLLNLILIYSLMMIQRIAAGLCFIF